MARKYFRFPVCIWEAAQQMKPNDRAKFYEAVVTYSFTGAEPKLSQNIRRIFELTKVYLPRPKQEV